MSDETLTITFRVIDDNTDLEESYYKLQNLLSSLGLEEI